LVVGGFWADSVPSSQDRCQRAEADKFNRGG
jgi:hypothetical protein